MRSSCSSRGGSTVGCFLGDALQEAGVGAGCRGGLRFCFFCQGEMAGAGGREAGSFAGLDFCRPRLEGAEVNFAVQEACLVLGNLQDRDGSHYQLRGMQGHGTFTICS